MNLGVVDEMAAPNMLLRYSLHQPRRGRQDIKSFMTGFRAAFPDLNFWGAADLLAQGDYVVGRREGGCTQRVRRSLIFCRRSSGRDRAENALYGHHGAEG